VILSLLIDMQRASRASISPPPLKRAGHSGPRRVLTNEQRRALLKWWNDDSYGKRKQDDARKWWKKQYGYELHRLTCSDILSPLYAYLDEDTVTKHELSSKRMRKQNWPTLEAVLIEWQIRYDKHPDSSSTTGDLLRYKAIEF